LEKKKLYDGLVKIFGPDNVTMEYADLLAISSVDNRLRKLSVYVPKYREKFLPDAIVTPTSKEQIVELVKFANRNKIPLIPRAGGTSLVGQLVAVKGGVMVNMAAMNKIKEINTRARYAIVEPGVMYKDLNAELHRRGYWFPPDPGSAYTCHVGGMVGTNASGMRACKYGTTADFVIGLEVVLPTGEVVKIGGKTLKSSSALEVKSLFVGSGGTLGIITEIAFRIDPKPAYEVSAVSGFPTLEDAGETAAEVLGTGIIPASMEIAAMPGVAAINIPLPDELKIFTPADGVEANLILRTDSSVEVAAKEEMKKILEICRKHHAVKVKEYTTEQAAKLWRSRADIAASGGRAAQTLNPLKEHGMAGGDVIGDLGVPLDKIPELIRGGSAICNKYGFKMTFIGHIGDGNIHVGFGYPFSKEGALMAAQCEKELVEFTVGLGGTITAEHGIGLWKSHLVPIEHPTSLLLMRKIKKALDPNGIMNPGKYNLDYLPEVVQAENWFKEGK